MAIDRNSLNIYGCVCLRNGLNGITNASSHHDPRAQKQSHQIKHFVRLRELSQWLNASG